ncbi:MAG: PKD domain-containing protein, partial [Thermodesulfobacteriota bacterium]
STPRPTVTAPPTAAPPAGNRAPTASLRQDQHFPDGQPGLVELDGTSSSDPDGQVVRYRFESGDGRIQDGPEPVARFAYAPGDYRASLVVFDDRGAASKPASRGFSVK